MTLAANETLNYANELQDKGNHQEAIKFYKLILDLRQKNEYENIKVTDKLIMEFGIDQGAEIKKENIKNILSKNIKNNREKRKLIFELFE